MLTSEPCLELLQAVLTARMAFPTITRNCEGQSKRTGRKYQYTDLNALLDAVVPVLAQHGVLLVQSLEDSEPGLLKVVTTLFHPKTGQSMSAGISVERPENMQDFGSTCTYLKRYSLQAQLGLSTEADDDAASLHGSSKPEKSAAAANGRPSEPISTNGPTHDSEPDLEHPTEAHLAALRSLAVKECHEEPEVFEQRIRTMMRLKSDASVSPRLMARVMTMAQYMTIFDHYTRLKSQLARKTPEGTAHGTPSSSQPGAQPAQPPAEAVPQDPHAGSPAGSSSAGENGHVDAVDPAYHKLYQEALGWGIAEPEIKHILGHYPLEKSRTILWKARRNEPPQVWEKVPAA